MGEQLIVLALVAVGGAMSTVFTAALYQPPRPDRQRTVHFDLMYAAFR